MSDIEQNHGDPAREYQEAARRGVSLHPHFREMLSRLPRNFLSAIHPKDDELVPEDRGPESLTASFGSVLDFQMPQDRVHRIAPVDRLKLVDQLLVSGVARLDDFKYTPEMWEDICLFYKFSSEYLHFSVPEIFQSSYVNRTFRFDMDVEHRGWIVAIKFSPKIVDNHKSWSYSVALMDPEGKKDEVISNRFIEFSQQKNLHEIAKSVYWDSMQIVKARFQILQATRGL